LTPCPKPTPRPPKARKPLKRSWIRRKAPRRLKREGSDRAYLAWVRTLPCVVGYPWFRAMNCCDGRIHAHHAIHRSQGGKDRDAIPLCEKHHRQWHEANGVFAEFSRLERFAWAVRAIAETRATHKREGQ
jgi:hypothetical protein